MFNIDTLKFLKYINIAFIIEEICFKASTDEVGRKKRKNHINGAFTM